MVVERTPNPAGNFFYLSGKGKAKFLSAYIVSLHFSGTLDFIGFFILKIILSYTRHPAQLPIHLGVTGSRGGYLIHHNRY